ncbi:MAG: biopolymer transport protein TolR [Motiliproteus sp.]|jgi:biopolymer transport protein TolR
MIKKLSQRGARLQRNPVKKPPSLNLVALMDIFTILVFFLLVNASNVQQPSSTGLRLPEARVENPVRETLVIQVNGSSILVQNRVIAELNDTLINGDQALIPALVEELRYQASRNPLPNPSTLPDPSALPAPSAPPQLRTATLMADRDIPFKLLKKIMLSAGEADYGQLSLAVIGRGQDAY